MSSTLKDIAEKTGFSVSTVSRVLHDNTKKYKISEETQEKVRNVAKEMGYKFGETAHLSSDGKVLKF